MTNSKGRVALPTILERLHREHPDARYELDWQTPLQLLVATILAAQCTDEKVNEVTPALFRKYPDARAFAYANPDELAEAVRPTGFFNEKAKAIQAACQTLVDRYGGQVPRDMDALTALPRVARKTANVVLTNAYNIPSGIVVDSHVARVSQRLGLATQKKPEKIEPELMEMVPKSEWIFFGPALVLHGRYTCTSAEPKCLTCPLEDVCEKNLGEETSPATSTPRERPHHMSKAKPTPASGSGGMAAQVATLPESWRNVLGPEFEKPYFTQLEAFVDHERQTHTVFPPEQDVFNALKYAPFDEMKVLLLGQDPYHDDGQAHGLCFSVRPGVKPPPSLVNMFKELKSDLGCTIPNNGYLVPWAEQGVLLLNAVLTVRAHEPNSHKDQGWEKFTDAVIRAASDRADPVVFVLWGAYAQKKDKLIDGDRHVILKAAHPSPLSAKKFFGSKPFSAVNDALRQLGKTPIDWQLPNL
jgi:uracil-DNA glycosylase